MRKPSLTEAAILQIAAIAVTMFLLLSFYSFLFSSVIANQRQGTFESLAASLESNLRQSITRIDNSAKQCSYAENVQSIIFFRKPEEYFQAAQSTEDLVSFILDGNSTIDSIYIAAKNGRSYFTSMEKRQLFERARESYWPDGNFDFEKPFFSRPLAYEKNGKQSFCVFYFYHFFNIRPGEYDRNDNAVCAIMLDVDEFLGKLRIDGSTNSLLAVADNGQIISSDKELSADKESLVLSLPAGRSSVEIDGEKLLANCVSLPELGWEIIYLVPESELLKGVVGMRNLSFFLLIVILVFLTAVSVRFSGILNRSIRKILKDMQLISEKKLLQIRPMPIRELQELAKGINGILSDINLAHEQEKQAQNALYCAMEAQHRAQILAYRSQINPHFFFNTLECMRSMAHHFKVEPLEKLIRNFSQLFRYALKSKIVTTVEDELNNIGNYTAILNQRQLNSVQLRIHVTPEARSAPLPVMSLQPIVENCFLHAFVLYKKNAPCTILVQGRIASTEHGRFLILQITDNGGGIEPDTLQKLNQTVRQNEERESSIGLPNIFRRISLIFGATGSLDIDSKAPFFTKVTITLPTSPHGLMGGPLPASGSDTPPATSQNTV